MNNPIFIEHLEKELKEVVMDMCRKEAQLIENESFLLEVSNRVLGPDISAVSKEATDADYASHAHDAASGVYSKECKDAIDCEEGSLDLVNFPPHYNQSLIQPIDVIEDWDLNYNLGNVVKYINRYRYKGTPLQDLKKAQWYLDRFINLIERGEFVGENKD